jgi:hypothetical protein
LMIANAGGLSGAFSAHAECFAPPAELRADMRVS